MARAYIKKPKVLIVDDITSKLDSVNEAIVLNAFEKVRECLGRVTSIVISSRHTSCTKNAD